MSTGILCIHSYCSCVNCANSKVFSQTAYQTTTGLPPSKYDQDSWCCWLQLEFS